MDSRQGNLEDESRQALDQVHDIQHKDEV